MRQPIENLPICLGVGTIRSVTYKNCAISAGGTKFDNCEFINCTWEGSQFMTFTNCTGEPKS